MTDLPLTYNRCSICGSQPYNRLDLMNIGPVRFWEPDDGWKIGSLCPGCYKAYGNAQPKPSDYAYRTQNCLTIDTDEDATIAM
uniref:Uncharacterized protein n=1 Tax=viral metagenome TaxID=1070528 RepID=A0A6M3LI11_9ZZZZ